MRSRRSRESSLPFAVYSEKGEVFNFAGAFRLLAEIVEFLVRRESERHVLHPSIGIERRAAVPVEAVRERRAIGRDVRDDLAHAILELKLHQRVRNLPAD